MGKPVQASLGLGLGIDLDGLDVDQPVDFIDSTLMNLILGAFSLPLGM